MNPLFLAAPIQTAGVTGGANPLENGGNGLPNGEGGNLFASVLQQASSSASPQGEFGKEHASLDKSGSDQPTLSGQESVEDIQESGLGSEGIIVANAESQHRNSVVTSLLGVPSQSLSTTTGSSISQILFGTDGEGIQPNVLMSLSGLSGVPQLVGDSLGPTIGQLVVGSEKASSLVQEGQGGQSLGQVNVSETLGRGPSVQVSPTAQTVSANVPSGDTGANIDLLIARPQQPTQDKPIIPLELGVGEKRTVGINRSTEFAPFDPSFSLRRGSDLGISVAPNGVPGNLMGQNQASPLGIPINPGFASANTTLSSGEGVSPSQTGNVSIQEQAAFNQQAFQEKEQAFTGGQPGPHHHLPTTLTENFEPRTSFSQQMEGTMRSGILNDRSHQVGASAPQRLQMDVTLADATKLQIEVAVQQRQVSANLLLDQMALRNLVLQNQPQLDAQMATAGLDLKEFGAEVREQGVFDQQGTEKRDARSSAQGEDQSSSADTPQTVPLTESEWGTQFHYVA